MEKQQVITLMVDVNPKPVVTDGRYFVKLASLDKQNVRGTPNYQITFNVSYIGLSFQYDKTNCNPEI